MKSNLTDLAKVWHPSSDKVPHLHLVNVFEHFEESENCGTVLKLENDHLHIFKKIVDYSFDYIYRLFK